MSKLAKGNEQPSPTAAVEGDRERPTGFRSMSRLSWSHLSWKKVSGGLLFTVGWLLSPLCWWNDLIINLPVAYGFGYLCHWVAADWALPGTIVGYWLSNLLGILLMQVGAIAVFQAPTQERNLKRELWLGVVSSSLFTAVVLLLIHFQILELPALFAEGTTHLGVLGSLWFEAAIAP
ncbi:MAG: hypothetical protein ACAF41_05290 [Leptolyngbya sp. BL-A-14]